MHDESVQDDAVCVFTTDDPAVLPLATMALENEGIAYQVKNAGKHDSLQWMMGQTPTTRPVVLDVFVAPDAAVRATEVLADLATRPAAAATAPAVPLTETSDPPAIHLESVDTGASLATITEAQLQELSSRLQESGPQQYTIDDAALRELESSSADPMLIDRLRQSVASGGGLVIRWVVR